MSVDVLIGIDAGTSVIKAVAFDLDGAQIGMASRRNSYRTLPNGGVEQDMARTWADTTAVLRDLADHVDGLADRAVVLAVTGQGDGTWLIDGDGRPVHDGWLWLDARAGEEAREIAASDGIDTIYRRTGSGVNVCQMRTHLTWLKRHAPDLLERATTAFHCKDWLFFNLTGQRATDPTEGVFTFGDIRTRDYSDDVLTALDLTEYRHLLPPIIDGAVETAPLSNTAANAIGLRPGLPVSLGYVDVMCSALGAGLHDASARPGLTVLGSTGMHMRYVDSAEDVHFSAERCGYTMAFPGRAFAQMQTNMAATLNIDWLLGVAVDVLKSQGLDRAQNDLLDGLDTRVLSARPGAALFHPYISAAGERGPFAEPNARASFTGMDQSTGWDDLVRAVFDGLVLAARDCYQAMGPIPNEVRLSGGAARSGALRKMLSACLGAPVRTVDQDEAGAAGAVMIAAIALGHFSDAAAATDAWVTPHLHALERPDAELSETYDHLFDAYLATRAAMPDMWTAQASMRRALA